MKRLGFVVGATLAAAIVLGAGCSTRATSEGPRAIQNDASIDGHERADHRNSVLLPDDGVAGTPYESSFGTLQPDGTYCGVFCSESH
jgi:hypothetical protein